MMEKARPLSLALLLFSAVAHGFQLPSFPQPTKAPSSGSSVQQPSQGSYGKTNPVLKAAVGLLTNGLNGAVGAREDEATLAAGAARRSSSISPQALKAKIKRDYEAAYFLTGDISADAYDEDCVFTGAWDSGVGRSHGFSFRPLPSPSMLIH